MKNKNLYTMPKLCTRNSDISKDWYVYFTFTDSVSGEKKQFRYKNGINVLKTKRERELCAGSWCLVLHIRLQSGWNPITDKTEEAPENVTVSQAFDNILSIKKAFITKRTYKTYFDQTNLFKHWLVKKHFDKLFVQNFTPNHARQFFDYLLRDKMYCGKTYNSLLGTVGTFFTAIVERETIKVSPIKGIKKVRQETGKNTTYSSQEETILSKYMYEKEKDFYYLTRFIRYCFFRRSELSMLQVKHIRWENKTIIVPSESGKSRTQDSVTISKTLEKIILEMEILNLDPNTYIFGKKQGSRSCNPSLIKTSRVENFSDRQRKINKFNDIKSECSFYSWKHTGAVELYNRTKDPYTVMRQCRHSDIKMTMIYLRSLGCGVNEDVREW
jgi:integrase